VAPPEVEEPPPPPIEAEAPRSIPITETDPVRPIDRPTLMDPEPLPFPTESGDADEAPDGAAGDDSERYKEIYVSVGRRDGVKAGEIVRILGEKGIDRALVDRIRVRDRSTFVAVRADVAAASVTALDGARFGDRVAMAEPAKRVKT
jgi:hypothetical protein